MTYKIKYFYYSGDSFKTEDMQDVLEASWEDLEVAKEALRRIKEHYEWYTEIEDARLPYNKNKKPKPPEWWNVAVPRYHGNTEHHLLNLPLDNGNEFQFSAPWCGYFEGLYGAEIITKDSTLSFDFRN